MVFSFPLLPPSLKKNPGLKTDMHETQKSKHCISVLCSRFKFARFYSEEAVVLFVDLMIIVTWVIKTNMRLKTHLTTQLSL